MHRASSDPFVLAFTAPIELSAPALWRPLPVGLLHLLFPVGSVEIEHPSRVLRRQLANRRQGRELIGTQLDVGCRNIFLKLLELARANDYTGYVGLMKE